MPLPLLKGPFTVEAYHRLAELGLLGDDDRVELLDGQIVAMTPMGPEHTRCVHALTQLLSRLVGETAIVRVHNPLVLSARCEPHPDLAAVKPRADTYRGAHPRPEDVLLLVEVADGSADLERRVRVPLYAKAGIPEVWLVDLHHHVVQVYRRPRPAGYLEMRPLGRGDALSALLLPTGSIAVDEILGLVASR
jgi:Uma2 family endonuclease